MENSSCLILGAGMCGLTAAQRLQERGVRVAVLEKGRGVGGRMATRRLEVDGQSAVFDHGAQFFTARSHEFQDTVAQWQSTSHAAEWFRGQSKVLGGHEIVQETDQHPRFCGTPGMTAIAKHLAHGLDIHLNQRVTQLSHEGNQWTATTVNQSTFRADTVILTAPVPQSLALLDAGGFALPATLRADLESVQYEPCLALMLALEGPGAVPAPGALYFEGEPISWLADNYQKGISPHPGSLTLHAAPQFSREHWSMPDGEVIEVLCAAAQPFLGENFSIRAASLQRWRYSKPANARNDGCVSVEPKLVFAGDAFGGAKVEGAFLSGLAAAKVLLD